MRETLQGCVTKHICMFAADNLGLRLRLRDGFIDCPPPKRRILLRDLGAWGAAQARFGAASESR
eukprot:scaffold79071_cov121-Phaeocystis_antarctica.AAC.1